MRTLEWLSETSELKMIDQRALPGELVWLRLSTHDEVISAIKDMTVRGAPAIGAAAAYGLALCAARSHAISSEGLLEELREAAKGLKAARPTAVNLAWAVDRVIAAVKKTAGEGGSVNEATLIEAERIADEDVAINERMAENGAALVQPGETIIHHCNTGALATVDWGTALGVIRKAHEQGKGIRVLVDETRPRLQGARLTAWELKHYGVPFDVISDNAAGSFLQRGEAQRVLVGADRVAANGDTANKIGTYMLALAAKDNDVPFHVVAPLSTIDLNTLTGDSIPIEERSQDEVLGLQVESKPIAPEGTTARNPAFDITPHSLITSIITEKGIAQPPYSQSLRGLKENSR
ncbi:MAG: S-methyl-5-thioribose-1-phosphate isomerase [Anaerolineae bacterium]|nr:MAG: S-methyl-5-thioribose-1-phosphate isomerase [Anaerolineae bacterium]